MLIKEFIFMGKNRLHKLCVVVCYYDVNTCGIK